MNHHRTIAALLIAAGLLQALPAAAQLNGATSSSAGEPYNVAARSYPSATQAVVSWSSNPPAVTAFRIERRVNGSRAWIQVAQVADSVRSYVDTGLAPSTRYEYRVSAVRADGTSALPSQGQVLLTTPAAGAASADDYARAAAPRQLDAQPLNSAEIMLSWQDLTPDETGFKIERSDAGGAWRVVDQVGANVTLYRDRGLQAATSYAYRVSALRADGSAPTSPAVAGRTPASGAASIFYVDAVNGSNANPGTEARPWATLQKAHGLLTAGQTVLVRAGVYTSSTNYAVLAINRSGADGAPITYRNFPGERPLVRTTKGVNNHGIEVRDAAYIVIDGFEVEGHVKQVTYEEAKAQNDLALAYSKMSPPKYIGATVDSNGISLTGKTLNKTHHITVRNNYVHDTPGGGIAGGFVDYVNFENNRVENTSAYSPYGTSGISLLTPYNFDTSTAAYHFVVAGNVVSGASNLFPCSCFGFKQPTDGNGIIIDTFNKYAFAGATLVANNIVFNNGGRGIHTLNSSYVDIFNNTVVRNGTIAITAEGEISVQKAKSVRVYNNIMVASADRPVNNLSTSTAVDFSYNIINGGSVYRPTPDAVGNRLATDPLFVATSGPYQFQLAADSPALNSAYGPMVVLPQDAYRAPRPLGAAADVGAVESF
jgi:parallel beta-helix repeat protein